MHVSSRTTLVSFSGIDGAGKSTQILNLQSCLQDVGLRVKLITFWDDVVALKRFREDAGHKLFSGDKGVGTPEAPIHRRDKNIRSPLMSLVRLGLYFLDALSLRKTVKNAMRSGSNIVIFDRYIYDELANLNLQSAVMRCYLRAIMKLVPTPQVSFVLDADPAQARARKPEYPLEFLYSNRDSYLRLGQLLSGITVIPPLPLLEAKTEVLQCVFRKLPTHGSQSDSAKYLIADRNAGAEAQLDKQETCPAVSESTDMRTDGVYQ